MIYTDIAKAVTNTLKHLFPEAKIYALGRIEDIERPAFYFTLKPVIVEAVNHRMRHNVLTLTITYFPKRVDEAEFYAVVTKMRDALGFSYPVKDSYVSINDFDWEFVGSNKNTLQMSATLEFLEAIPQTVTAEPMKTIHVTIKKEE